MLQKILFESFQSKTQDKTSHVHKKYSSSTSFNLISLSKKILYNKYSKFEYSFSLFCTNNLIFNEKCRIVARFKDFLVLDDSTEFLRRLYFKKELKNRLQKIFNFYESYFKIFPNYIILPESQFLYRNIRKKQKMIDAFNEIKKEEEENRKHLKLGLKDENKKKEANVVFTEKIKESIERYHPSVSNILNNTFMSEISNNLNNEIGSNDKSMITISLSSHKPLNLIDFNSNCNSNSNKDFFGLDKYFTPNKNSFDEKEKNFNDITFNSQNSIFNIVKILNSSSSKQNNKNSNINNNNYSSTTYNKTSKKDFKKNFSQMNKIGKKNFNSNTINNNIKSNTKKFLNINTNVNNRNPNFNSVNVNSKSNSNSNKITGIYHSNNKNKKSNQDNNNIIKSHKKKFISHKQTGSVPLASNMLNSHENNIIDGNTIKIINNINNIIINEGKINTINNEMVININNNYFQLKESKKVNDKNVKRVKSKEEHKKSKTKSKDKRNDKEKEDKEDEYPQFKLFREKRAYTNYNNTQNNPKKNKKFLLNEIHSPNKKKESNNNQIPNGDNNKKLYKNINSNNYYTNINNNRQNNVYRNSNNCINDSKKNNKKLIESKTLNNNNSHTVNHNKNITEINNNYSNILGGKFKLSINKNIKEKPKLEGVESIDQKKISINRKIVNNYLTTTQKKKTYQGRFRANENSSLNTFTNNKKNNENNNVKSEKIEVLNICNSLEAKNNPIKFKLDKKNMIRKIKTNSLQINNKNQFLSSFNLAKEKIPGTNIELDIINIEDNIFKHHKKSIKKLVNNKTQTNSESELFSGMNNKNYVYNTVHNKSIKKDKIKIINDKKNNNDINKINSTHEIKKINVKEMKEKYHKLLRGNKITHGSYDTANRLHLLKKFRGVSNGIGNMTNSIINNTTTTNKNKRSPLGKKNILSPSERISNNLSNYIKTPIKNKLNLTHKESSIENNNFGGNKFYMLGKKNKQLDTNNKKMKFIKK